jgi:hypothetical protein
MRAQTTLMWTQEMKLFRDAHWQQPQCLVSTAVPHCQSCSRHGGWMAGGDVMGMRLQEATINQSINVTSVAMKFLENSCQPLGDVA